MSTYFSEQQGDKVNLVIQVEEQLHKEVSEFQTIEVFQSEDFGKILVIDGVLMLTERDEFIYHEMMVHVPLAVHPRVHRALVIGGGDGGALRELLRYPEIEEIDLVEIDERVVRVSQEFFPQLASSFDSDRVHLHIADGLKYIRKWEDHYDLILVDSTDPIGPGVSLFTREFYGNCFKALKSDGILVNQHESPFYDEQARMVWEIRRQTRAVFPVNFLYQAYIPSYPSGHWLFGFMSKGYHPLKDHKPGVWEARGLTTRYYNSRIHQGAFALPTYVQALLDQTGEDFIPVLGGGDQRS